MRALAQLMLPVAVVVAVLTYGDSPAEPQQGAKLAMTSGGISLENSKNGTAVFNVGNLAPGGTGGGQVSLANSGTLSGDLTLSQADIVDAPGAFGGQLSGAVHLSVVDQSNGNAIVYSGPLAGMGQRPLGRLAPGESRSYSFAITLPDGGTPPSPSGGDNAFRGSKLTARYHWDLVEVPSGGGGGGGSGDGGIKWDTDWKGTSSMRMYGRMSVKLALRKGVVNVYLRCSEVCRVRARVGLRKRPSLTSRRKP